MAEILVRQYTSLSSVTLDIILEGGPQDDASELATAALVCLCTDARALPDDLLPDPDDANLRGWWGNTEAAEIWAGWDIGSRLWLLSRAKITGQNAKGGGTLYLIETYIRECLQPLVTQRIASRFMVQVERVDIERVAASITIYRGPTAVVELRFQSLWDNVRS